jgi:hypothetical protein
MKQQATPPVKTPTKFARGKGRRASADSEREETIANNPKRHGESGRGRYTGIKLIRAGQSER